MCIALIRVEKRSSPSPPPDAFYLFYVFGRVCRRSVVKPFVSSSRSGGRRGVGVMVGFHFIFPCGLHSAVPNLPTSLGTIIKP